MDEIRGHILNSIIELVIAQDSKQIRTHWSGLRLRAALKENEDEVLRNELDDLKDVERVVKNWNIENDMVVIDVADEQKIPEVDLSTKEIVCDRAIRRALIYKLYEEYRRSGNSFTHYALGQLKDILEITKDEILRHVDYLMNEDYLIYKVMDGGMATSDITHNGIKLCEAKSNLFEIFGTVQIKINDQKEEKIEVDEDKKRRIFVVHGRNEMARRAIFSFLRSLGLEPIEWSEAIRYTGTGTPYVGEILDNAFKMAQAVIVLITGDDIAKLSSQYIKEIDPEYERKFMPQPRPNVLFEAGLAFGRQPERTILVALDSCRPFSDIGGRHILRIVNDAKARQDLVSRLKTAGCDVKTEGRTDWLHEGDFDGAGKSHTENIEKEIESLKNSKSTTKEEDRLEKEEDEILKYLGVNAGKKYSASELASDLSIPLVKIQYYLDRLTEKGYLYVIRIAGATTRYYLNPKGRVYVVEKLGL